MSIILKRGRYLSNGKLYNPGDILPNTARSLVKSGDAEILKDNVPQSPKSEKSAPDKPDGQEPENGDGAGNS